MNASCCRIWLVVASAAMTFAGCVADQTEKKAVGPQPKDSKPGVMWMAINPPKDTNGNGYVDSLVATVYLFADNGYVRSISVPGTYHFKMVGKGGKVLRDWKIEFPGPKAASIKTGVGNGQLIALSLLDDSVGDIYSYQSVDLFGEFTAKDGTTTVQSAPNAVLIGNTSGG
ncbi:MAG: hypothetical protein JSR77_08255 [Planctomycetes bacterium]|nr:hypothetical protein [Planctomycetota bacterium]